MTEKSLSKFNLGGGDIAIKDATARTEIENINTELSEAISNITSLQTSLSQAESDINTLNGYISALNNNINTINDNISSLQYNEILVQEQTKTTSASGYITGIVVYANYDIISVIPLQAGTYAKIGQAGAGIQARVLNMSDDTPLANTNITLRVLYCRKRSV